MKMELNIDKDNLEKALSGVGDKKESKECKCRPGEECKCDKEEEAGFHKGALNTLVNERNELLKMIYNVEAIMQAHIKRLEEMGVKVKKEDR